MTLIALLALLVVWVVSFGGGGGNRNGRGSGGAAPATSITPGPSGTGPAISEQPGGRDESGGSDGGGSGDTSGGAGNGGTGSGGTGGATGGDGGKNGDPAGAGGAGTGGDGTGGAGSGTGVLTGGAAGGGTVVGGRQVPAGSSLPNCAPRALTLRLDTTKVAYEPGEKPAFRLALTNTSATNCKANLGPKSVVVTVTNAEDEEVWSSKDCPAAGSLLFEVPARATVTRTVEWDRRQSAPGCATAPTATVGPGTYLVEAKASGASVKQGQKSIRLEKD